MKEEDHPTTTTTTSTSSSTTTSGGETGGMSTMYDTYMPPGFSTVTPYIFVPDAIKMIEFLKSAFHAEELHRTVDDTNKNAIVVRCCILKIGGTSLMISQQPGGQDDKFSGMKSSFYLYVQDVDAMYKRVLDHGGKSLFEPSDMSYGDRQAGVEDPFGCISWWISMRLEKKPYGNH